MWHQQRLLNGVQMGDELVWRVQDQFTPKSITLEERDITLLTSAYTYSLSTEASGHASMTLEGYQMVF